MNPQFKTEASPRVLLVEDSLVELVIIKKLLEDNGINVVGTAMNGVEALEKIPELDPDVICTDYHMPEMDGMVLTQRVMEKYPRPILVLSISAQPYQVHNILNILKAGALDVMAKPLPHNGGVAHTDAKQLVEKIRILSGVKIISKFNKKSPDLSRFESVTLPTHVKVPEIIGIGSSTGGPQALLKILSEIPDNFSIPIVCVQHISVGFLSGFVEWLNDNAHLSVVAAEAGMSPHSGYVYVAPESHHLELDANKRFRLMPTTTTDIYVPSVDRLFTSLAEVYRSACVGVVLSGMGSDGSQGVTAIHRNGGLTLAQDEASSVIFGMPKCAIETGSVTEVWPLNHLSQRLIELQTPTKG